MSDILIDSPEFRAEEYLTLDMLDQLIELKNSSRWRPLFVTGTDTEVGKTYISAFLAKALQDKVYGESSLPIEASPRISPKEQANTLGDAEQLSTSNALAQSNKFNLQRNKRDFSKIEQVLGYYKAAISGSIDLESSDAGYVKKVANLSQELSSMTPYHFVEPLSPHLAAERVGKRLSFAKVIDGLIDAYGASERLVFEGTGGLFCPFGVTDEAIVLSQTVNYGPLNDLQELYAWVKTQEKSRIVRMCRQGEGGLNAAHSSNLEQDGNQEELDNDHYSKMVKLTAAKVTPRLFTICDIMRFLHTTVNLGVVLVGNSGLGSINHITCSFNCLQQAGFKPHEIVIIMNNFKSDDPMHQSNLATVRQMNPALGVFTVGHDQQADEVFTQPDFVEAMQQLLVRKD